MSKYNMLLISVVLMGILFCWATTSVDEQSSDEKKNVSMMGINKDENVQYSDKRDGKYFNYLRLPDGECHNCSTYKCTNHKANLGGSEWCIMLFPDALAHCDSDINCGGYTMTTAEWFHTKYDKNGQVAVHLNKIGPKPISCPLSEWSSYEKQKSIRSTPVIYGRSTCETNNQVTCDHPQNVNYVFVSNSNAINSGSSYLCKDHPKNLDNKDTNCILSIADGITYCNLDNQCQGFMINTDQNWEKKYSNNGMQAVQLFGQGATYIPSQNWRTFKKQQ
jgi:hypothetical protein